MGKTAQAQKAAHFSVKAQFGSAQHVWAIVCAQSFENPRLTYAHTYTHTHTHRCARALSSSPKTMKDENESQEKEEEEELG